MTKNIVICLVFLSAFSGITPAQNHPQNNVNFSVDLHKVSPRQLLSILDFRSDTAKGARYVTVSFDPPENWVRQEDLGYLMKLIGSKDKCRCVIKVFSDYLPIDDYSTIGGQAMNMIDSYRNRKSYFEGSANCAKTDSLRQKEVEVWWSGRKDK
jgi:hypothetical protein